jgi:hypothetical protein
MSSQPDVPGWFKGNARKARQLLKVIGRRNIRKGKDMTEAPELDVSNWSGGQADMFLDAIALASDQGEMTWLTGNGKRVAAIVPPDEAGFEAAITTRLLETERERILHRLIDCRTCGHYHNPASTYTPRHPNRSPWIPAGADPRESALGFLRQLLGDGPLP